MSVFLRAYGTLKLCYNEILILSAPLLNLNTQNMYGTINHQPPFKMLLRLTPITLQCISAQGIANLDRACITYLHQTQYENILHLPKYFFETIPTARYIIPISSSAFTTVDQVGNSRFIQAMSISFLQSLVVLMSCSMIFRTGTGTRRHIPSRNQSVTPSTSLTRSFRCTSPRTKEGWGRNQGYGFQQLINYINTFVNASRKNQHHQIPHLWVSLITSPLITGPG